MKINIMNDDIYAYYYNCTWTEFLFLRPMIRISVVPHSPEKRIIAWMLKSR